MELLLFKKTMYEKWILASTSILVIILMAFFSKIGAHLSFPFNGVEVSAFWPPSGIALATLLLCGKRMIPAIFLGACLGNLLVLDYTLHSANTDVFVAFFIALISTLQTFLAFSIITKLTGTKWMSSFDNSLIFVLFSGFITNVFASSIAVPMLSYFGYLSWSRFLFYWSAFWSGDTVGVLVGTPFVVSLFTIKTIEVFQKHRVESFFALLIFALITYLCFGLGYPMLQFYLLLIIWASFRFGIEGQSLMMMMIAIACVAGTLLGVGLFTNFSPQEAMLILSSFIIVGASAGLLLSGILQENRLMYEKLDQSRVKLLSEVVRKSETIHKFEKSSSIKNQIHSMDMLLRGLSLEMHKPLMEIHECIKDADTCLSFFSLTYEKTKSLLPQKEGVGHLLERVENNFSSLQNTHRKIQERTFSLEKTIDRALKLVHGFENGLPIKHSDSLYELLEALVFEQKELHSHLDLAIEWNLDPKMKELSLFSNHLDRVMTAILENSFDALCEKRRKVKDFKPLLIIKTKFLEDEILIEVTDNGIGIQEEFIPFIFHPFFRLNQSEGRLGLALSYCYDWVVKELRGKIEVKSIYQEYTTLTLRLPHTAFAMPSE